MNLYVLLRLAIGLIFVASGFQKAMAPYQSFQYVIEQYQILPHILEKAAAIVLPWIELLAGVFLILGLWLDYALSVLFCLSFLFVMALTQALVRHLPLESCGCFADGLKVAPQRMVLIDVGILFLIFLLKKRIRSASRFSLDAFFSAR